MVLSSPKNGSGTQQFCDFTDDGELLDAAHRLSEELDSGCSTPYVSAPSSPGRGPSPSGYFYSAPASPIHHFLLSSENEQVCSPSEAAANFLTTLESSGSFEFEFSSRFSPNASNGGGNGGGLMISADELFLNGQIRPMKLSSHLQRPQILDGECNDEGVAWSLNGSDRFTRGRDLRARNKSVHRKARSMSPLRTVEFNWHAINKEINEEEGEEINEEINKEIEMQSAETTPSCSASSSRSSSSGRNSKKWIFLKDLLHRSKSEGRSNNKERFWSAISFSPAAKEKKLSSPVLTPSSSRDEKNEKQPTPPEKIKRKGSKQRLYKKSTAAAGKPVNGVSKRRASAHELHYTTNRAQAEEMKKKTYLPYRQGLLGCLGFSSKGYGALNGFTKSLNPISSR